MFGLMDQWQVKGSKALCEYLQTWGLTLPLTAIVSAPSLLLIRRMELIVQEMALLAFLFGLARGANIILSRDRVIYTDIFIYGIEKFQLDG